MKILLLLIAVLVSSFEVIQAAENVYNPYMECIKNYPNVNHTALRSHKATLTEKCFTECILDKAGLMRDGKVYEQRIMKQVKVLTETVNGDPRFKIKVETKKWSNGLKKCIHKSPKGKCAKAFSLWNCILFTMDKSTINPYPSTVKPTEVKESTTAETV